MQRFTVNLILDIVKEKKSVCVCFCMISKIKKNNLRCMQWFKRCKGPCSWSWSEALTNRRKKQKVIVDPFEGNRATVWHGGANNEFSWEGNQSESRSLLTLTHFIPAKMSIVYLLLFAFALKSRNIPPFPDVALCSSCLIRLR